MSDLISRQAAIEAICKSCSMEEDYHKCDGYSETSTWCDELVALRALPSAQPEIIRCKDCKWKNNHNCTRAVEVWIDDNKYCAWAERREE